MQNWETDANDWVYVILQRGEKDFELACKAMGFEDWLTNPDFSTADARDRNKQAIWNRIQSFTITRTKDEVVQALAPYGVPCAPVLSMKEIQDDPSLRQAKAIVEIDQGGEVGKFLTVGCPCTFSNYEPNYGPCPELGGNTEEILKGIGYTPDQIRSFAKNGTTAPLPDGQM